MNERPRDGGATVEDRTLEPDRPRRLTRRRDDRVIAGVASGIGRHLGVDPTLIRLAFVVLTFAGGSGVLAYLIAWLIIPEETGADQGGATSSPPDPTTLRVAAGALLVLVGAWWLLEQLLPGVARLAGPVALLALGIALIGAGTRR